MNSWKAVHGWNLMTELVRTLVAPTAGERWRGKERGGAESDRPQGAARKLQVPTK